MYILEESTFLFDHGLKFDRVGTLHVPYESLDVLEVANCIELIWLLNLQLSQREHVQKENLDVCRTMRTDKLPEPQVPLKACQEGYGFDRDNFLLLLVSDGLVILLPLAISLLIFAILSLIFAALLTIFVSSILLLRILFHHFWSASHQAKVNRLDPVLRVPYLLT